MPLKNGTVFCVNHPHIAMTRNRGFNAITTFARTGVGFEFNPSTGIPVVAFYCDECGYVETYAAQKTQFWSEIADSIDPSLNGKLFESTIRNALENLSGAKSVEENVRFSAGARLAEVDLLMRTQNAIYVCEVKTKLSQSNVTDAVRQVKNAAKVVEDTLGDSRPVYPVVIVPAKGVEYPEVDGVKFLQFDIGASRFVNPDIFG